MVDDVDDKQNKKSSAEGAVYLTRHQLAYITVGPVML